METTHNSVKVKLGIKVMKLAESLIGREVTVGQGSECHLTFVRGLLHIAQQDPRIDHKTSWMTISSVPQGIPVWVAYWKSPGPQNKTFIRGASPGVSYKLRDKHAVGRRWRNITTQERKVCDVEIEIISLVVDGSVKLTIPPNRQK